MSVNGLEKMTACIIQDAQQRAAELLEQARVDCEEITAAYAAKADSIRERLSREAQAEGEELIAKVKAASAAQKRDLLLQQRGELIDGVFTGAREWVMSLDQEKYTDLVAGLAAAALFELVDTEHRNRTLYGDEESAEAPYELLLNKKDRDRCGNSILELTCKKLTGKIPSEHLGRVKLGDKPINIDGGVVLRWGEVESNCSFSILFSQLARELSADVQDALFAQRGQSR